MVSIKVENINKKHQNNTKKTHKKTKKKTKILPLVPAGGLLAGLAVASFQGVSSAARKSIQRPSGWHDVG